MTFIFLAWLAVYAAFALALFVREPAELSKAHHANYASTLYWIAAAFWAAGRLATGAAAVVLVLMWLAVADDAVEHWGGPSAVRWAYGKLGGTR